MSLESDIARIAQQEQEVFGRIAEAYFQRHGDQSDALAMIAANSPQSQAAAATACPDVPVSSDYRQLIAQPDIDVVDIVVPTHLHADIAVAALQHGKHVLLEKPMAASVSDCQRILAAAERQHHHDERDQAERCALGLPESLHVGGSARPGSTYTVASRCSSARRFSSTTFTARASASALSEGSKATLTATSSRSGPRCMVRR